MTGKLVRELLVQYLLISTLDSMRSESSFDTRILVVSAESVANTKICYAATAVGEAASSTGGAGMIGLTIKFRLAQ
jgi:hypothetical protein